MAAVFEVQTKFKDDATPQLATLKGTLTALEKDGSAALDKLSGVSVRSLTAISKQADALRQSNERLGLSGKDLARNLDLATLATAAARDLGRYKAALDAGTITTEQFATAQARIKATFEGGSFLPTFAGDLERVGASARTGAAGVEELTPHAQNAHRAMHALSQEGLGQLARQLPVTGDAVASLAGSLTGLSGGFGIAVAVGAGLLTYLVTLNADARKAVFAINELSQSLAANSQQTSLGVAQTQASGQGAAARATVVPGAGSAAAAAIADTQVIKLEYEKQIAAANAARDAKLRALAEERDQSLSGITNLFKNKEALTQKFTAEEAAAEATALNVRREATAKQQEALLALDRALYAERKKLAEDWFATQQARSQAVAGIDLSVVESRRSADAAIAAIDAESTQNALAAIEARGEAQRVAIQNELDQRLAEADALSAVDWDLAEQKRVAAVAKADDAIAQLDAKLAADRLSLVRSNTDELASLYQGLGSRAVEALKPLQLLDISQNLQRQLGLLDAAYKSGLLPLNDYITLTTIARQAAEDAANVIQFNLGPGIAAVAANAEAGAAAFADYGAAASAAASGLYGMAAAANAATASVAQLQTQQAQQVSAGTGLPASTGLGGQPIPGSSGGVVAPLVGGDPRANLFILPSWYPTFQEGGWVPGTPGQKVPIVAHAGEYVVPADQARGGGGMGGDSPIHVHLEGTTILDTDKRLYQLAGRIADLITDRARRGLTRTTSRRP